MEASAFRERPVFVAADGRRARRLRYAALAALALSGLWLGGLVLGSLGFGQLPGLRLPQIGGASDRPVTTPQRGNEPAAQAGLAPSVSVRASDAARSGHRATAPVRTPHASPAHRRVGAEPAVQARTNRPSSTPAAVAPQPAATAVAPAHQGWSRRGLTEPAGQTHRTTVQSQPTPSGQTRARGGGHDTTTTTTPATPVTAPVPPGQQKKADDPDPTG